MARIFNFSAGPAVMPEEVLAQARDEMLDWHGTGMSIMEMSHRSKAFISVASTAESDLRSLLGIPGTYKVLFLQGGAQAQFALVPMNRCSEARPSFSSAAAKGPAPSAVAYTEMKENAMIAVVAPRMPKRTPAQTSGIIMM